MFLNCCCNWSCMMKVENVDLNIATFKYLSIPSGCYFFDYNFYFFHLMTFQNFCIKKNFISWKNEKQLQNAFIEALLFLALFVKKLILVHKFFCEVTLGLSVKFFWNSFFWGEKWSYSLPKLETQSFRKLK